MMIRPPTSSIGDRKHLRANLFQPAWGRSPRPVLQELVTGTTVAGHSFAFHHRLLWSLPASCLEGVHDAVVNELA